MVELVVVVVAAAVAPTAAVSVALVSCQYNCCCCWYIFCQNGACGFLYFPCRLSVELNKTAGATFFKTSLPFAYAEDYGEEDACLGHWVAYVRKVELFFF